MLYIANSTVSQRLYIPLSSSLSGGTLRLKLESTVGRAERLNAVITGTVNGSYLATDITLASLLPIGEYTWRLTENAIEACSGVAVVGSYHGQTTEYDRYETYQQYESE